MSELARKLIALRWHIEEKSLDRRCSMDFGSTIEYYALRQGCVSGQLAVETVETHCQGQENCNPRDELHHTVLTQATLGKTSLIVDDKSLKEKKSQISISHSDKSQLTIALYWGGCAQVPQLMRGRVVPMHAAVYLYIQSVTIHQSQFWGSLVGSIVLSE